MINKLKSDKYPSLSKAETLSIIHLYIKELREFCQQDNLKNEDFDSPSWSLKQAHNCGAIKMLNKLELFLPLDKINKNDN